MGQATTDTALVIAAIRGVSKRLDRLLVYLQTADQLLRSGSGRVGPALVGGIESAAAALADVDRVRRQATAAVAGHGAGGAPPPLALVAAGDPAGAEQLASLAAHVRRQIAEVDRLGAALRRRSSDKSPALAGSNTHVRRARTLVRDALHQGLDDLVPEDLRIFVTPQPSEAAFSREH